MTELWALDLDEDRYPVRAHLLVEHVERTGGHLGGGQTACGQRYYPFMQGLNATENGDLPLSGPEDIHCGRTPEQVVAYRTAKGWAAMDDELRRLLYPGVTQTADVHE